MPSPSTTSAAAPPNDPGWANVNVSTSSNGNYVYLGNRWALTARHVGPEPSYLDQSLTFSTGTYHIVPGMNFVVSNPTTYVNSFGQTVTIPFSLTAETDLRLVRLDRDPGLTEICATANSCAITATTPLQDSQVTFIGHGPSRLGDTVITSNGQLGYNVATSAPLNNVKRWGTNNLENPSSYRTPNGPLSNTKFLPGPTGVLPLTTPGDGMTRDVISFVTDYDHSGSPFTSTEAQAVSGDSGTSVFYFDTANNQWYLAGIVNAAYTYKDQTPNTVVNGNVTTIADLSYYRSIILSTMQSAPGAGVINGDVNLDGVLSGGTMGGVPTGDIAAFVSGWGYNNGTGIGDLSSWQHGDLNRDGKTDVSDFMIMRSALSATGAGGIANFDALFGMGGGAAVPEPTSCLLLLTGAGFFAYSRLRRRG
jgi:hypothetical protein